jgi:hypothetical protein
MGDTGETFPLRFTFIGDGASTLGAFRISYATLSITWLATSACAPTFILPAMTRSPMRSNRMLKKIIQVSSLVFTLAVAGGISANAGTLGGNEEDAAAPVGSFTSAMAVPASSNFDVSERRARHEHFAMRFAQSGGARAMRQDSEKQK